MQAIHWFRSDLPLADNAALAGACRRADAMALVFVLDDALLNRNRDAHPRLRFLHACLEDFAAALDATGSRLIVVRGARHRCLPALARACKAALVTSRLTLWGPPFGIAARALGPAKYVCNERILTALAKRDIDKTGLSLVETPAGYYSPQHKNPPRRTLQSKRASAPRTVAATSSFRFPPFVDTPS